MSIFTDAASGKVDPAAVMQQVADASAKPPAAPATTPAAVTTPVVPSAADAPTSIANEHENFVDEWAKAPDGAPPVRTWVDPSLRNTPQGEYLSAWYDTPASSNTGAATQSVPFDSEQASRNAAAIASETQAATDSQSKSDAGASQASGAMPIDPLNPFFYTPEGQKALSAASAPAAPQDGAGGQA